MAANSAVFQNWFLGGSKLNDCLISVADMLNHVCVQENKKAQRKWARYKNDFGWIKIQNCQIHKKIPHLKKFASAQFTSDEKLILMLILMLAIYFGDIRSEILSPKSKFRH